MADSTWLPQIALLAAGALATLFGALAYIWKRDADRKLLDVRRQADDALQQARQVTALTQAIARLADSWTRSDERATDERRRFGDIVAAHTEAQARLTQTVEATRQTALTLHDDVTGLRHAVEALPDTTAERVQNALAPLVARLEAVRVELADARTLLADVTAP